MNRTLLTLSIVLVSTTVASAQIGRGGKVGGGGGMARPAGGGNFGGGGGNRPSFTPPAQNRPAPQIQRPQAPQMQRPQAPQIQRPQTPQIQRPSVQPGLVPHTKPNLPQTLPGNADGGLSRPNLPNTLPGGNGGGVQRPNLPDTKPNIPGFNGGGVQRPDTRPNLPNTLPATRPNLPDTRPNIPGVQRPSLPDTKPNLPPGFNGGGVQRPNLPDTRPGGNGSLLRPGVLPDRPNINPNNRPDWANNTNNGIINNRPNNGIINNGNVINNRPINNNNFTNIAPTIYNPSRPYGGYTKPYYGNVYRPYGYANYGNNHMWGNYYVGRYYSGWHQGYWNNPFHYPYGFVARPVPLGWLLPASVNWNYYNPYWSQPQTVVQYVNYSQPLPVDSQVEQAAPIETPYTPAAAPAVEDTKAKDAAAIFDAARASFMKNDYATAEATITKAIAILPQDPTLHEFRALTLFAQGKYVDSAAAIYAVLAAGPGWNSETLYALYPDKQTYANQLAALERFTTANPASGPAFFLLGYEFLTLGDKEKAATAFEAAYKIEPKDELSKIMAQNLRTPADATQP